jgi:hypothetical protein
MTITMNDNPENLPMTTDATRVVIFVCSVATVD